LQLYLPIAELPVDILVILGMGIAVGFISGMFGVGGGFLMTPLLIFVGIPPAVAVATEASQIAASSMTGSIVYWRKRALDVKLGCVWRAVSLGPGWVSSFSIRCGALVNWKRSSFYRT
jgi:uncharacterized membrane protein YfcA